MIHPLLEKHIPSKTYVSFLKENDISFSEFETAAILSNIYEWREKTKLDVLKEYMQEVQDENLKEQIRQYVQEGEEDICLFADNENSDFVYLVHPNFYGPCVECDSDTVVGIVADLETAVKTGLEIDPEFFETDDMKVEGFVVKKYEVKKPNLKTTSTSYGYLNPYLFPDCSVEELRTEGIRIPDDGEVGWMVFTLAGELHNFHVSRQSDGKETVEDIRKDYDPFTFYNTYIDYPNPFEIGDIVYYAEEGREQNELPKRVGLINESQEQYRAFRERLERGEISREMLDQFDSGTTVEWFHEEDASFGHWHDKRIFLEKYDVPKEDPRKEVLEAGSRLLRGEGALDYFTIMQKTYCEKKQSN